MKEWDKQDRLALTEEGKNDYAVEIKREEREGEMDEIVWPRLNRK